MEGGGGEEWRATTKGGGQATEQVLSAFALNDAATILTVDTDDDAFVG